MSRIKKEKSLMLPPLRGDKTSERFGTPLIVAEHRAERLKCDAIVEIGASAGFQTYAFARICRQVCAIEIDSKKFNLLKRNMSQYDNVTLIKGDALNKTVIKKVQKFNPDIVFVDTQRPDFEKKRTLKSLQPDIRRILEEYGKITEEISIEVPPQIREIPFDCEKEYISLYNKLNRLTLYFGNLKGCDTRVVFLPRGGEMKGVPRAEPVEDFSSFWNCKRRGYGYIYEINPAVTRAGLSYIIAGRVGGELFKEGSKIYLATHKLMDTPIARPYKVVKVTRRPLKVGKRVVLKGHVKGAEFLVLKKRFEGSKKMRSKMQRNSSVRNVVFVFGRRERRRFIVCEEIENAS